MNNYVRATGLSEGSLFEDWTGRQLSKHVHSGKFEEEEANVLCGCTAPVQDLPQQAEGYAPLFFLGLL